MCDLEHVENLIDQRPELLVKLDHLERQHVADIVVRRIAEEMESYAASDADEDPERWDGMA